MPDLVAARCRLRGDKRRRRHDLAGRAEAALHGVRAHERVDERMVAQSFDRRDLGAVDRVHEGDAREHRRSVHEHRARTAVALAARDLRAGQAEVLTEDLCKRAPDGCVDGVRVAVDLKVKHRSSPQRCPQGG